MTPFDQPDVRPIPGKLYELCTDWVYEWEKDGETYRLSIPAGFVCDLDSTPWWAWWLFGTGKDGPQRAAVLAHDDVYSRAGLGMGVVTIDVDAEPEDRRAYQQFVDGEWVGLCDVWSKGNADRLMFRIMRECGVPRWHRRLKYWAVSRFGWRAWNAHLARNTAKV